VVKAWGGRVDIEDDIARKILIWLNLSDVCFSFKTPTGQGVRVGFTGSIQGLEFDFVQ